MDYRRYLANYTRDLDANLRDQDPQLEQHGCRLLDRHSERLEEQKEILTALKKVGEKRIEIGEQRNREMDDLTQLLHQYEADQRVELRRLLGFWPAQPPPGPIRRLVRRAFRGGFRVVVVYLLAIMNIVFIGAFAAALRVFMPAWIPLDPYPSWISVMVAAFFVWHRRGILMTFAAFGGSILVLVLAGMGEQVREMAAG